MGRIVHFEYFTQDPDAAVAFYRDVLGWSVEKWGEEPYWLVTTGDPDARGINGGIAPPFPPSEQRVINTADVEDIDAVIEKALAAGGKVVSPKEQVQGVGWVAYLADPAGIVFGVLQGEESQQ